MIDIKKRIALIEGLVAKDEIHSFTYAALECRLAVEEICYERLLISHNYISRADLKKWTPAQVVKQVSEEANENVASGLTLFISKEPVEVGKEPKSVSDYEALDYVKVGEQVGFTIKKMHSLWQGLSNVALHISLPEEKQPLSGYGNLEVIKAKVLDAIDIFKEFEPQTLLMGSTGPANSFECIECGTLIRRNAALLKDGQVINCFNPTCDETYTVERTGDEITYTRRLIPILCKVCATECPVQTKAVERLRSTDVLSVNCPKCGGTTLARFQLVQEKPTAG